MIKVTTKQMHCPSCGQNFVIPEGAIYKCSICEGHPDFIAGHQPAPNPTNEPQTPPQAKQMHCMTCGQNYDCDRSVHEYFCVTCSVGLPLREGVAPTDKGFVFAPTLTWKSNNSDTAPPAKACGPQSLEVIRGVISDRHCPTCKQNMGTQGTICLHCGSAVVMGVLPDSESPLPPPSLTTPPPIDRVKRGYIRFAISFSYDVSVAAILTPVLLAFPIGFAAGWWMGEFFSVPIAAGACGVLYCLLGLRVILKGENDGEE